MVTETSCTTVPPRPGQVATPYAEQATEILTELVMTGVDESAPGRPTRREPDRWLPLLLFILAVVLAFDYRLFGLG